MKGLGKFVTEFMSTDGAVPPTEADWAAALLTDKPPALTVAADATINPAADDERPATTVDEKSPEYACARLKLIHEDIAAAQKKLVKIPDACRRGLSLETLKIFGCGYLPDWTSTKSRIKGSHPTTTPRLIIPTPNHYLARLIVPLEIFPEAQREYIQLKPHEGSKDTFNLYDALNQISRNPSQFLTVTEGEIDAMSIWQACAVPVVATSGADSWKRTLTNLETRGEYISGGNFKLRVLILFDPDDTGRKAAPQFRAALMSAGIPAVVKFLSPEVCKLDANQILCEQGEAALREIFAKLTEDIDEKFAAAENEIAARQESPAIKQAGDSDFERVHNLEQGIKPSTSSGSGNLRDYDDEPPELVQEKVSTMLNWIDPRSLTRNQWLAVMTALKNLGVDYVVADAFNQRDPDRYDERANLSTWNSLTEHYGVEVLAARARDAGFDFKNFYHQWYEAHPEYSKRKPYRRLTNSNRKFAQECTSADDAADANGNAPEFSPYYIPPDDDSWQEIFYKPFTNLGDANRLADAFGKHIRYATDVDGWYIYRDGVWNFASSKDSALFPYARAMAEYIRNRAEELDSQLEALASKDLAEHNAKVNAGNEEKSNAPNPKLELLRKEAPAAKKLARRWQEHKHLSAAIKLMKGDPRLLITTDKFDTAKYLLNVANGTVDLKTGRLKPHNPADLLTRKSDVVYDPSEHSDAFANFMIDILPDELTRRAVLRYLGYCLTGDCCEEKALFIHGTGGNGKGTLTAVLAAILGRYATSLSIHSFLQRRAEKDGDAPTPEFTKLVGARLAVINEIPKGRRLDTATFKNLTGRDPFAFRRLRCEGSVNVNPTHKFIFSGNDLPRLDDPTDGGLKRRLLVADFPRSFTDEDCDPRLKERLLEPENLTGALNVLVAECLAWQRDGLIESDEMKQEKTSYLNDNNWLAAFLEDNCKLSDGSISRKDFIDRLKRDCPQARQLGTQSLTKLVESLDGVSYQRTRAGFYFFGIDWQDNPQGTTLGA